MSAVSASPTASGSPWDPVRALQHTLYRAAKVDPGRRFHSLWDKILRRDVLWRAWVTVRCNDGAPGVDEPLWPMSRSTAWIGFLMSWPIICAVGSTGCCRRGGCSFPSPVGRMSADRCRFRRIGIGSCRQAAVRPCSSRSSRRTCCRAALGFGPGMVRMTGCRF